MSFLRKRSRSQCSISFGDDQMTVSQTEQPDFDRKSRSETINSARSSCSEAEISDFAVHESCVARNFPKQKSSHLRFLAWVAYTRRFAGEGITEDERRTCPLLWCRATFKDQEAMLQHVWNCEHLSKGLYWCFHCRKPERVGKSQCRRCQGLPTRADRVASVAKRIFSKLGAKPYRHEHTVGPDSRKTLSDVSEAIAMSNFQSLQEKTPFQAPGPINWIQQEPQELPNTAVMSEMPGDWTAASVELPDSPIAEMVGTECPVELGNGAETWEDNFYAENLEEWDVPLVTSSKGRGRSPKLALDTSVPPVLPHSYEKQMPTFNSNWTGAPLNDTIISPLSPDGGTTSFDLNTLDISPTDSEASVHSFFTDSGYSSATSLSWSFSVNGLSRNSSVESKKGKEIQKMDKIPEAWISEPVYARPVTVPDLPSNVQDLSRRSSSASHSSNRCIKNSKPQWTSSSTLLQSFTDVLDEHIKHTKIALQQMTPSDIIMELLAMSRTSMVSIGLDVLAGILEGRNPTAIVQVFAFTHVACASAIAIDGDKAKVQTQTWFQDSLAWIPERQRPLYLQIAKAIWDPKDYPGMEEPFARSSLDRQNLVLSTCKDFLHIFEYSQILESQSTSNVERIFDFAQSAFEQNAKLNVIDELIKISSIEGFFEIVGCVGQRLELGTIKSSRALELELICAGKLASQSDITYNRFQEHVMMLCNILYAMETRASQPRIFYYIRDISLIKNLIPEETHQGKKQSEEEDDDDDDDLLNNFDFERFETDAEEALRSGTFPYPSALEITEPEIPITSEQNLAEPQPIHYSNDPTPLNSHPPTPHSHLPTSPYPPPPQFSTPPVQEPPTSNSTSMPPPPTYRCHCGYIPTGEDKWKASNLRRHKRTQHPVEAKVYSCPFPGCTGQYSRSDNLRDHQRRKGHEVRSGMGSSSGSGQGSKRRKVGEGSGNS